MKSPGALETIPSVKAKNHEKELEIPLTERLKSIPEVFGIRVNEEPHYEVLRTDGDFELRRYQDQLLAEVSIVGADFETFREQAFEKLAKYIFGGNISQRKMMDEVPTETEIKQKQSENVAMTAPVLQQQGEKNEWIMSFILPKKFTRETAPTPVDDSVQLREVSGYEAAAIRYSGTNSEAAIREHEEKLAVWIRAQNDLRPNGPFFSAQYDGPFAIPLFRRNEVLMKVVQLT